MDESLVEEVRERADDICEYCRMPQSYYPTVVFEGSTRGFGHRSREPSPFRQARRPENLKKRGLSQPLQLSQILYNY